MARFTSIVTATLFALPASLSVVAAVLALAGTPAGAVEPASAAVAPVAVAPAISTLAPALRPGEFHWADDAATDGPLLIAVSIVDQKLYAYRNGALFAVSTVSTGKRGHATPTGAFSILEKHRDHRSSKYNNAPMPYMQRLTWDGVALHAGALPGYPASHGCVRLPLAFAQRLFGVTDRGATVIVTDRSLAERRLPGSPFEIAAGPITPSTAAADLVTMSDLAAPNAVAALLDARAG